MPLYENLPNWKAKHREDAGGRYDPEHEEERQRHLRVMFENYKNIYSLTETNQKIENLKREFTASDLRLVGFVERLFTHQKNTIIFLADPRRIVFIEKSLVKLLTADANTDLYQYEDHLEFFIINITKKQNAPNHDEFDSPIGEPYI